MAEIEVRPATREDVAEFLGRTDLTVRALAGWLGEKRIGMGGLVFQRGRVVAFCDLSDEMKRFPVTLHKAALRLLQEAAAAGHRFVFAERDPEQPTAERWLTRLGFRPLNDDGTVMLWQP